MGEVFDWVLTLVFSAFCIIFMVGVYLSLGPVFYESEPLSVVELTEPPVFILIIIGTLIIFAGLVLVRWLGGGSDKK